MAVPAAAAAMLAAPACSSSELRAVPWDEVLVSDDGTRASISYEARERSCRRFDHTEVEYLEGVVLVTIWEEALSSDSCRPGSVQSTSVEFGEPVGDRLVRDGSGAVDPAQRDG
jgi:hypothetical protein